MEESTARQVGSCDEESQGQRAVVPREDELAGDVGVWRRVEESTLHIRWQVRGRRAVDNPVGVRIAHAVRAVSARRKRVAMAEIAAVNDEKLTRSNSTGEAKANTSVSSVDGLRLSLDGEGALGHSENWLVVEEGA